MKEQLEAIAKKAFEELAQSQDLKALDAVRVKYLGKKGELTAILKQMGKLSAEERPVIGQLANQVRGDIEEKLEQTKSELENKMLDLRLATETLDVTLPGKKNVIGKRHPLTVVLDELKEIVIGMGFEIAQGPEVELDYYNFEALNIPKDHPARDTQDTFYINDNVVLRTQTSPIQIQGPEVELDYYNFEALNIPKDHPARDTQDTFYINDNVVLRTQTSPIQIRVMENQKPPIRILAPGRVYRADEVDATHSPLFHQVEGLVVDKNITMADLKGTLEVFVKKLYGEDTVVRFRPHHFPFTEPSAELDVQCFHCHGEGCSLCKGEGWIEILGCGMVHPKVQTNCGIDPEEYSGFAFGMGLERMVMMRYNIDDLRLFYDNDIRFLNQF